MLSLTKVGVSGFVHKAKLLEDKGDIHIVAQSEVYSGLDQKGLSHALLDL